MTIARVAAACLVLVGGATDPRLGAQSGPPRATAAPALVGTARVRGVVVDPAQGRPVRSARVTLEVTPLASQNTIRHTTTSDGDGGFEFHDLPAGRIRVWAARPGYYDPNAVPGSRRQTVPFSLGDGQVVGGVQIVLRRGLGISGRVTDQFGDPAEGARVQLFRRPTAGRPAEAFYATGASATTDDRGDYRVWGLMPGEYFVSAEPSQRDFGPPASDGTDRTGQAATFYPGTPDLAGAGVVAVREGQDAAGVSFALGTARLASVRGQIARPPGLRGRVNVSTISVDGNGGRQGFGTTVHDDGGFEVRRLAPGRYRLTAQQWSEAEGRTAVYGTVEVQVDGVDLEGVTIPVHAGTTITGRIISADGPLPDGMRIQVMLQAGSQREGVPFMRPVRAADDGTFRLDGAFGRQYVRASFVGAGDRPGWQLEAVRRDGRDVTDELLEFTGAPIELEIVMTSRIATVEGTATWDKRGPAPPVVVVFAADEALWEMPTRWVRATPVSDAGTFEIRGLPPGDDYLAVAVENTAVADMLAPAALAAVRDAATRLRVERGGLHELALHAVPKPAP